CVASMTLVCYDQIKGVNRDVQFRGVFINFLVPGSKDGVSTEEVDSHPLDCADVYEGVTCVRVCQVRTRQHLGIVLLILVEVSALEPLTVNLVNLVELESRFRLERSESQHCLCSKCPPIYQEQNALSHS